MRIISAAAVPAVAIGIFGCAGGGGHHGGGGHGAGQGQDPGQQGPGGNVEPARGAVACSGRVVLQTPQGGLDSLPNIKVMAKDPNGRIINSTFTDRDGSYTLALDPNVTNIIGASHNGYSYAPEQIVLRPRGPENIPLIVAKRRHFAIPGIIPAGPAPDAGNAPGTAGGPQVLQGMIEGQIKLDPRTPALDALMFHDITIRDAASNRVIAVVQTDRNNRFRFTGNAGNSVVIEPRPKAGLRWHPSSLRIQVPRGSREVQFLYEPVAAPSPAPSRPRYPAQLLRPAQPTPPPARSMYLRAQ